VNEAPGEGNDEIVVRCNPPGGVVSTPGVAGSGSIERPPESMTFASVETVTVPIACASGSGGGGGGGGSNPFPTPDSAPVPEPAPEEPELWGIVVTAARGASTVRLDASASFLAHAEEARDPAGWAWQLLGPQRGNAYRS
jgi:hypothetical protein